MALTSAQLTIIRIRDRAVWHDEEAQADLESYAAQVVIRLDPIASDLGVNYDEVLALWTIHDIRCALPQFAHGAGETTGASDASGNSRTSQALRLPIGMVLELSKTTAGQKVIGYLDQLPREPMLCI